jgi:hypothetical protein
MGPSLFQLLAREIDVAEASDDPHDQSNNLKNITGAKISIEKVAQKKPDEDGQDQGHTDGRGLVTSLEQFFQKFFGVVSQLIPGLGPRQKYFFSHVPSYHTPKAKSNIFG